MARHDDHSPIARLASERLAMPGVVDRAPAEGRYERLQQGTVKQELTERLSRRATASGDGGGASLVWRRSSAPAAPSADGLPAPVTPGSVPVTARSVPAPGSGPGSRTNSPVVQRATASEAETSAVTARLASWAQSPGVLATGSTISRPAEAGSFSNAPAFAASLQSRYGVTSSDAAAAVAPAQAAAPTLSISRAAAGVVRRQVETSSATAPPSSHGSGSVVQTSSRASRLAAAAPLLARQAPAATAMATPS